MIQMNEMDLPKLIRTKVAKKTLLDLPQKGTISSSPFTVLEQLDREIMEIQDTFDIIKENPNQEAWEAQHKK